MTNDERQKERRGRVRRAAIHLPAWRGTSLTVTATCEVLKTPRRGTGRSFVSISPQWRLLGSPVALGLSQPGGTGDLLLPVEERGGVCPAGKGTLGTSGDT